MTASAPSWSARRAPTRPAPGAPRPTSTPAAPDIRPPADGQNQDLPPLGGVISSRPTASTPGGTSTSGGSAGTAETAAGASPDPTSELLTTSVDPRGARDINREAAGGPPPAGSVLIEAAQGGS